MKIIQAFILSAVVLLVSAEFAHASSVEAGPQIEFPCGGGSGPIDSPDGDSDGN